MKRLRETGLDDATAIKAAMVETQIQLADIANKNQAEALAKLNNVTSLAADKAVTAQINKDLKTAAAMEFQKFVKDKDTKAQVGEVRRQLGLIDQNTSLSDSDKEILVDSILSVARKMFGRNFDQAIDGTGGLMDERFKAGLENQLPGNDMFDGEGDARLLTPKELTERNLKIADVTGQNAKNLLKQQEMLARGGRGGFNDEVGGLNMPVVAPTTNDSRDQSSKIYNYTFYSTDSNRGGPGANRRFQVPANF